MLSIMEAVVAKLAEQLLLPTPEDLRSTEVISNFIKHLSTVESTKITQNSFVRLAAEQ